MPLGILLVLSIILAQSSPDTPPGADPAKPADPAVPPPETTPAPPIPPVQPPVEPVPTPPPPPPPGPVLEVVAQLPAPPGNIAVTPDNRLIVSMHPFGAPKMRVLEVLRDSTTKAFPSEEWSGPPRPDGIGIAAIIGIECDRTGAVWMLDAGSSANGKDQPLVVPKLVAWDTRTNALARVIHLPPPACAPNSFMQDFAVDLTHQAVFIADTGRGDLLGDSTPAIVVVDLRTGLAKRRLQGNASLQPENVPIVIDGRAVSAAGSNGAASEPRLGLNPITIDPRDEWVFFGSMNGTALYRVRTLDLIHPALSDEQLGNLVEKYGPKGVSDGISVDSAGNLYVTDLNNKAIGVLGADRAYRLYLEDPRLLWPDGLSCGPDGFFYLTVNQLHRHAILNGGKSEAAPPFLIMRFKPIAPSDVGR
jgi:hypothetical protein